MDASAAIAIISRSPVSIYQRKGLLTFNFIGGDEELCNFLGIYYSCFGLAPFIC